MPASFPSWTSLVRIPSPALDRSLTPNARYAYLPAVGSAAKRFRKTVHVLFWRASESHAMPRTTRPPAYRLHKARNLAVVTLAGKDHYLGPYGSPESHEAYARLIADWHASGQRLPAAPAPSADRPQLTVNEVILAFWEHAKRHYRHADRAPTRELDNYQDSLRPLRKLFGRTLASEFGPLRLRAVREEMVRADLCRQTINARIHRIRRVFRWAASQELVPASV